MDECTDTYLQVAARIRARMQHPHANVYTGSSRVGLRWCAATQTLNCTCTISTTLAAPPPAPSTWTHRIANMKTRRQYTDTHTQAHMHARSPKH
eukprot:2871941-Pleurochrysis_carterae.AAC.2